MTHPTFADLAHHLVDYHPPKDQATADLLGAVREGFHLLIDHVAQAVPDGPDATLAARSIHRACQDVIASIILNQEGTHG